MKGLHKLTASGLALFLAASFVVFSWSAPQAHFQRRNWTPQAMLYLKGAQGRRFIPEESQRKDLYDRMQLGKCSAQGQVMHRPFHRLWGKSVGFVFLKSYTRKQLNPLLLVPSLQKAQDKVAFHSRAPV
ncbi:spexin isoform X1 [Manacus candei]|uniref:spexin isoform X1 n=1 Tax=Manacus candei TaxID=415023 RepID=UPI0022279DF7|nr:spexin isoform X1 [Manacus candei]